MQSAKSVKIQQGEEENALEKTMFVQIGKIAHGNFLSGQSTCLSCNLPNYGKSLKSTENLKPSF